MAEYYAPLWASEESIERCQEISIGTLPNDVLLAIFNFYLYGPGFLLEREKGWQSLVHVCRRWRNIVFGSPRHLDLQLVCTERTPARDTLDVWPALPLIIMCYGDYRTGSADDIVSVLDYSDRVRQIILTNVPSSDLEIFLAAMQQPFPELTNLELRLYDETVPVVLDSFLGGSAPHLAYLHLEGIPFPGLPKLLLSATHLTSASLEYIPHSGYFSPETMVTALSTLTSLEILSLKFQSPRSCPDQASRSLPPSTRHIFPVLTYFRFKGVCEYLEDLVGHIDTPQLNSLDIAFFNDIAFNTPEFIQFMSRTPTLKVLEKARITFLDRATHISFLSQTSDSWMFRVIILCRGLDWQLSSLEQVCTSCLSPLSVLEDVYIYKGLNSELDWKDKIENGLWLELMRPFTTMKNLYLSKEFAPRIAPALQELIEGRTTEVFPALQNIFLEGLESPGSAQEGIGQLVAARQVASHPITISHWANAKEETSHWY